MGYFGVERLDNEILKSCRTIPNVSILVSTRRNRRYFFRIRECGVPKWYRLSRYCSPKRGFLSKKKHFLFGGDFSPKKPWHHKELVRVYKHLGSFGFFETTLCWFGRFLDLGFGSLEDDSSLTCTLIPMPNKTMVQRESLGPECPGDPHGVSSFGPDFYLIDDRPLSIEVQLIFWKSWGRSQDKGLPVCV